MTPNHAHTTVSTPQPTKVKITQSLTAVTCDVFRRAHRLQSSFQTRHSHLQILRHGVSATCRRGLPPTSPHTFFPGTSAVRFLWWRLRRYKAVVCGSVRDNDTAEESVVQRAPPHAARTDGGVVSPGIPAPGCRIVRRRQARKGAHRRRLGAAQRRELVSGRQGRRWGGCADDSRIGAVAPLQQRSHGSVRRRRLSVGFLSKGSHVWVMWGTWFRTVPYSTSCRGQKG